MLWLHNFILSENETREIWRETVEKAVEICAEKFPSTLYETQIKCIPSFVQFIYFCMHAELFINCPRMSIVNECETLREKSKDCLKSDASFQFPAYYYKWKFSVRKGKIEKEEIDNEVDEEGGNEE